MKRTTESTPRVREGLALVGARQPLGSYIRSVWDRRGFAWIMALYANEAKTAHTRLGRWWTIIQPTIQVSIYGLIFGFILGANKPDNFLPYLFTGVFFFTFMSGCLVAGSKAITGNSGLVTSINFPRVILPVQTVIRQMVTFIQTLPILLILVLGYEILVFKTIKWEIVLLPIPIVLMAFFGFGVAATAARMHARLRDLDQLIPFMNRVLFYASGVFFSIDKALEGHPFWAAAMRINPFYDFMELARGALVTGYSWDWSLALVCLVWAIVAPVFGLIFFWRGEETYGNR